MDPIADQSLKEVFDSNLYCVDSIDALPIDSVCQALLSDHIACLRGLFDSNSINAARETLAKSFSSQNDNPTSGNPADFTRRNFQKIRVGTVPDKPHIARLLRTFYSPLWAVDLYGMHAIFRNLAKIRNKLLGRPDDFAIAREEDGLWTSARIHQYPTGGGFMSAHRDSVAASAVAKEGLKYVQLLVCMSQKGVDYERGGAYMIHDKGRIPVDDFCQLGDVVIYDGGSLHGVDEIDPHKRLDLDSFCGRAAAFANLWGHQ